MAGGESVERVVFDIIRYGAIFIAEEMGVVLRNTAFSPNIKDRLDYSCAILSPEGYLVAQAEHIPVHLGSMFVGARNMVEYILGEGMRIRPGDVFVSNDPYITGTHLNDIMLLKPVFVGGRLVAFVTNKAHHVDVGGHTPGSIGFGASSLIEEGIVIPPMRLAVQERIRTDILRLIEANIRTRKYFRGDLMAQLAALNIGERRIKELALRYSPDVLEAAWEEMLSYTERYARNALAELVEKYGQGVFKAEDYIEMPDGRLLPIRATVEVSLEKLVVDFTGTAKQVEEPLNAVYGVTVAATTFALKAVIDPEMPMNHGFYRVVEINAPRGSLVNPLPPAPVGGGNVETSQRIADVVLRALAKAFPDRVPAASCGTMTNLLLGGEDWAFYETIACGSGGRPIGDGVDGVHTNMTNTLNTPIEIAEQEYPIMFKAYELRRDSGGPGKYRGGLGVTRALTVLRDNVTAMVFSERYRLRPWGLAGGKPGAPSRHYLVRKSGEKIELGGKARIVMHRGDTLYVNTPGGGGYGHPCERRRELVERDIAEEKVSVEHARKEYCYEG